MKQAKVTIQDHFLCLHSFVEIDHEIFSTVIHSLPLIQEGQLSVSGERMCTILVNRLEDQVCPVNVWLGKLTALDMTLLGWLVRKTSTQTNTQRQSTYQWCQCFDFCYILFEKRDKYFQFSRYRADTQCWNKFDLTLIQRLDVESTLFQRCVPAGYSLFEVYPYIININPYSSRRHSYTLSRKQGLTFPVNRLLCKRFSGNLKPYFLWKII